MRGRRQVGVVDEINSPAAGEEVALFPLSRVVQNSGEVDGGGEDVPAVIVSAGTDYRHYLRTFLGRNQGLGSSPGEGHVVVDVGDWRRVLEVVVGHVAEVVGLGYADSCNNFKL